MMFAVLSVAYIVSQFFRVANSVIAPELMTGLGIGPAAMGIITAAFFFAFAAMQLPVGILLDRFGPRRTMASLLFVAALGSLLFAVGESAFVLTLARALIGVGCAAGLMGSLIVIARWFPPERFARLSSLLFTVGGVGILLGTTPLAAVSVSVGWREAFYLMAGVSALMGVLIYLRVRDLPPGSEPPAAESVREIAKGLGEVLRNRELWHISAIQFVTYASVLTLTGLWAGPYLEEVFHLDPLNRGHFLLAMNLATLVGVMAYSWVEQWIGSRKWTIVLGAVASIAMLALLATRPGLPLTSASVLLISFALVSSFVMLLHSHARAVLPAPLMGRGLTLQNLAVFIGVAVLQAVSGYLVQHFTVEGMSPESIYRVVFGFLAVSLTIGLMCYLPSKNVSASE